MAEPRETTETKTVVRETANDRFKRGFADWFWLSLIIATLLHAALFFVLPQFGVDEWAFAATEIETIDLPDQIEIPPPPEAIQRPATPVISDVQIDDDITIAPTTFEENPIENLPPPPTGETDLSAAPVYTPMTIRPQIQNMRQVQAALERHYPPMLRDAQIGGTVNVWFFIDENGRVQDTRIAESSGYDAFDRAAISVANVMEFSPAYNRDQRVPVWVAFDITFEVR
jgi:TonB family protein